jgi:transcriptional regulator GlxA family with amidase domain
MQIGFLIGDRLGKRRLTRTQGGPAARMAPSSAGLAKLSISHFTRAFKQSEGLPPHEYLVRCRVQRVRELLAETDLPLAEIGLHLVFRIKATARAVSANMSA